MTALATVLPAAEPDRVWNTIPDKPGRPFGAALSPEQDGRIPEPFYITEPTRLPKKGLSK